MGCILSPVQDDESVGRHISLLVVSPSSWSTYCLALLSRVGRPIV